jgi:broad specificity phosphatase PhoE
MTELIFVRHGSTSNLELRQWQGWSPVPLSDLGREQALATAKSLAEEASITQLFSSPIERARETAGVIAAATGANVQHLDALMERMAPTRLWGIAHADSLDYVNGTREHRFDADWRFEDEEPWQVLSSRVLELTQTMRDLAAGDGFAGTRIVLVTHGITLRMIAAALLIGAEAPISHRLRLAQGLGAVECCSMTRFELRRDEARLLAWNQTGHLKPVAAAGEVTW